MTGKKLSDQEIKAETALIEQKSKDPVVRAVIRSIAALLVALSGLMLFADKAIDIELDNTYGFKSTKTFIWVLSQSASPMLLMLGAIFRPWRMAYAIPCYIYTIQVIWVFSPEILLDDWILHLYAAGATAFFVVLIAVSDYGIRKAKLERSKRIMLLESLVEAAFKIKRGRSDGRD